MGGGRGKAQFDFVVEGELELTEDVELMLGHGGVAYTHRFGVFIAGEPG